jgi:beta-xylosidase
MKRGLHDLSVLFDDDGKAYVVWGYRDLHIAQLTESLDDIVPDTEHTPFGPDSLIGEGSHFYKINGKYVITSAWYAGRMRMACARASSPFGPYELNPEISADESFGLTSGNRLASDKGGVFRISPLNPNGDGRGIAMHQGGIVETQTGEWWGWSMMDANSVGRLTCLSPVTWKDGWPYFGLPGNLGRTPRTWVKPNTGHHNKVHAPYVRNDDFRSTHLANAWQWNHAPTNDHWSLTERKRHLRLHSLPAPDFFAARNSLTQRAIGPVSSPIVELDPSALKVGDVAGLGLLNWPFSWIGVQKTTNGWQISTFDQATGKTAETSFPGKRLWLRADCDFLEETGQFSYSLDGKDFRTLGEPIKLVFQLRTFQGIRYALFNFGSGGGYADFANFRIEEPRPTALTRPIPYGKSVDLAIMDRASSLNIAGAGNRFRIIDGKLGRVALEAADGRRVTVQGTEVVLAKPTAGDSQLFQWTEMPRGDLLLLSLASHRYLRADLDGTVHADAPGAQYNRQNGASFTWKSL